jgi:hypothetical protein
MYMQYICVFENTEAIAGTEDRGFKSLSGCNILGIYHTDTQCHCVYLCIFCCLTSKLIKQCFFNLDFVK